VAPFDEEQVLRSIVAVRDACNDTNPERTDYYHRYWLANPEVPWTLMANLVSRNAGYQMSDLSRFTARIVDPLAIVMLPELVRFAVWQLRALWAFLEVGNWLIFRDVCPPLEAWAYAKSHPEHTDAVFDALARPEVAADAFAIREWKRFATSGRMPDDIARHTMALVINEQNQIEDRLVRRFEGYIGALGGASTSALVDAYGRVGLTVLLFPLAEPAAVHPFASALAIYHVGDFGSLESRILTGRDIFKGLFAAGDLRRQRVEAWSQRNPRHTGSRADYHFAAFSDDPRSLSTTQPGPIDPTYSPRLIGRNAAWYLPLPRTTPTWAHLYRDPGVVPVAVDARPAPDLQRWLDSWQQPAAPMAEHAPAEFVEILDEDA
jgi:hypothetical protein